MKPLRLALFVSLFLIAAPAQAQITNSTSSATSTPPSCQIAVSPSTVVPGGSVTLRWQSTRATSASITGLGAVAVNGQANLVVPLTAQTTFVGTFTGAGGTRQCQATVYVSASAGNGTGGTGEGSNGSCSGSDCVTSGTDGIQSGNTIQGQNPPPLTGSSPAPRGGTQTITDASPGGLVPCTGINCNICDIGRLIQRIINFMIGIAIPLAALLFAYAGFLLWSSGANTGQRDTAKRIFTDVLIGFLIAIAAFLIVQTIMKVLLRDQYQSWNTIQCAPNSLRPGVERPITINEVLQSVLPNLISGNRTPDAVFSPTTGGWNGVDPNYVPTSGGGGEAFADPYAEYPDMSGGLGQCPAGYFYSNEASNCYNPETEEETEPLKYLSGGGTSAVGAAAAAYYGTDTSMGPDSGNLACAWAVNNILKSQGLAPLDTDSVFYMERALNTNDRGTLVGSNTDLSSTREGDIVIWKNQYMSHVGICENDGCTRVLSNSSGSATFTSVTDAGFNRSVPSRIYRVNY